MKSDISVTQRRYTIDNIAIGDTILRRNDAEEERKIRNIHSELKQEKMTQNAIDSIWNQMEYFHNINDFRYFDSKDYFWKEKKNENCLRCARADSIGHQSPSSLLRRMLCTIFALCGNKASKKIMFTTHPVSPFLSSILPIIVSHGFFYLSAVLNWRLHRIGLVRKMKWILCRLWVRSYEVPSLPLHIYELINVWTVSEYDEVIER